MLRKTVKIEYDLFNRSTITITTVKLWGILLYTLVMEENREQRKENH